MFLMNTAFNERGFRAKNSSRLVKVILGQKLEKVEKLQFQT